MPSGPRAVDPQASVWMKESAGSRRKRTAPAGLGLGKIVQAAIRLLDEDGLGRFSMRRLAAELGVTPMSVYWYVETKDDLLEIALDEVMGEVPLLEGVEADWREVVRELAVGYRRMLVAHPWASRLMGEFINIGPKSTAFSAAAVQAARRSGLPDEMITGALAAVYQFVYGFGTIEGRWAERCRAAGVSEDEFLAATAAAVRDRPDFAPMTDIMEQRMRRSLAEQRERDFAYALDCVIAGIEVMRDRAARS